MLRISFFMLLRSLCVGMLLGSTTAKAQSLPGPAAPHGYDFLTVIEESSYDDSLARLYFMPALPGKAEVALESSPATSNRLYNNAPKKQQLRYQAAIRRNMELVSQQLSELTVAGWEFVQAWAADATSTRYLFRKARP